MGLGPRPLHLQILNQLITPLLTLCRCYLGCISRSSLIRYTRVIVGERIPVLAPAQPPSVNLDASPAHVVQLVTFEESASLFAPPC